VSHAYAVSPGNRVGEFLAGAQFADAFRITVTEPDLDAPTAAKRMLARNPAWVTGLMRLRNLIVRPLGLKTPVPSTGAGETRIGMFPVIASTPQRVVVGLDDSHLDFRVMVDVVRQDQRTDVTTTTIVKTHNRLGRCYLAAILPFHRIIVRTMLEQVKVP
jgi:hypothetical protein